MAHKEQHHKRDQKKPKKVRQHEQVGSHRSGLVEQINANETAQAKP